MIRRIASACLALLILISALPLGAAAAVVGETVWLPAGENPGAGWEPKADEWMRNNCDLEGHVHDESCVSDNLLVCTVDPGTHVHDQNCGYYDTQYQWIYTGNAAGEPTGTPTTLTVCNLDPSGNPVVGAEFFLYEDKGTAIVQIGETVTTDAEGKATFTGLALPENVNEATWYMAQKSLGESEENYRPNNAKYKVTIVRNADDTHTVTVEEKQTITLTNSKKVKAAAAGEKGTTTVFINELQERMLLINMEFVNDVIPKDSYKVTLTGPNGFKEELTFSADMDGYYWQALVKVTKTGTYTIQMDESAAQAEGYTLTTSYKSQLYNPNAESMGNEKTGNTIKLNSIFNAGTMTITNHYKMPVPETVILKAVDTLGNPLGGAGYGAFYGKTDLTKLGDEPVLDTDGDGEQIIPVQDYLEQGKRFLEEGVPETVVLKQTTAPEGYELSQNTYPLTVTLVNQETGELDYVIDGTGAQMKDGVMTLPFRHEAKTGILTVKLEPQGTVPESVTEFSGYVTNGQKSWDLTFPAAGGEKRLELPLGEYTVMLDTEAAKVTGYDLLAPVYSSQKVTFAADGDTAQCVITTGYERIKDPANRVLVKAVDSETEAVLSGAEFVLVSEGGEETKLTKSNADGSFLVENLEDLAVTGETVTYYLRQSKTPFGYRESRDEYLVKIKESKGTVTVETQRQANVFSRLLRSGVEEVPEYGQTAVFVNEAILVDLKVAMELNVNFGKLPLEKIPVTITGENFEETFELGNGKTHTLKDLKMGEYTVTQQAEVEGYTLTTKYAPEALMNGNKLTLPENGGVLEISNSYDNSAGSLRVVARPYDAPEGLDSIPVEITNAEGEVTSAVLTMDDGWAYGRFELSPGTYSVAIAEEDILLKGYILDSSTAAAQTVTVKSKEETDCIFDLLFKKAGTDVPTTVQFSIRDQFERVVPGATIHISTIDLEVTDNGERDQNKDDGVITVDLTDDMTTVLSGLTHLTLWMKQTGAPEGYAVSSAMIPLTLEMVGSEFQCSVGGDATTAGSQIFVTLENEVLDTATIRAKLNLTGDIPQSIIDGYSFLVSYREKNGYDGSMWIDSNANGIAEEELPCGTYTVYTWHDNAAVEGYDHTITYDPETVTLSENGQVEECVVTIQYTKKVTKGTLNLTLDFGDTVPEGLESVTVVAKDAAGKTTSIPVTAANQWKATMELPEGEYTFDVNPVDGYDIQVVQENIKAPVTKDTPASVTLSLTAEKDEEPVQVEFDKIVLYIKDTKGNLLPGAKVSAYVTLEDLEVAVIQDAQDGGEQDADGETDGKFELDGITAMIEEYKGKLPDGEYSLELKQTQPPEGYTETSDTVITVTVTKAGDKLEYSVAGATVEDRVMYLTMEHPVKTGSLNLEIEMKGSSVPESVTEIEVTATDTETGDLYTERVTKADDWKLTWELPLGSYTLNQTPDSVAADGYNLTTVTSPETVTVTEEDAASCTITNTYSKKAENVADKGNLKVTLAFRNKKAPEGVKSMTVLAKNAASKKTTKITVSAQKDWTAVQELEVGTYTLSLGSLSGYTLTAEEKDVQAVVMKNRTAEAAMTVSYEKSEESNSATKPTTKPTEDEENVEATGKLTIRTVDEKGNLWGGAKYGLFHGSTEIRSFTDYGTGVIKIDDPELVMGIYTNSMIGSGARLVLKQTRTPDGAADLSERMYTVRVLLVDNVVMLEAEGAEMDAEGTQIVEFSNRHPVQNTEPAAKNTDSSNTIVIRTLDDAGNALTGAEYCLSADQYFDKNEDAVYTEADRHGEIVIKDLHKYLGNAKSATYYLMQSRQPDNSKLSTDTFKVELSWKNGRLDVKVKKDEGLFDTKSNGSVEEGTDGEWIVNFVSKQKMTTIQVNYTETVNWNNVLKVEDMLQSFRQEEYEFQLKWDYLGEPQEPLTLKLRNGESGSFEPIPNGARYEIVLPQGSFKAVAKQEDLQGRAAEDTVTVDTEMIYNIVPGAPLMIEMVRIDAETEKPLAGAVYALKDAEKEEVDTYKTRSDGRFVVDAITEPGEYTLTETETPDGYSKIKKAIHLNVALKLEQSTDSNGDPVILQKLEADVTHSMVKQLSSGAYRIGSAQDGGSGNGLIIAGAVAAAAGAAGAGALLLKKRKRKRAF